MESSSRRSMARSVRVLKTRRCTSRGSWKCRGRMRTSGCQPASGASRKSSSSEENEVLTESSVELAERSMSRGAHGQQQACLSSGTREHKDANAAAWTQSSNKSTGVSSLFCPRSEHRKPKSSVQKTTALQTHAEALRNKLRKLERFNSSNATSRT